MNDRERQQALYRLKAIHRNALEKMKNTYDDWDTLIRAMDAVADPEGDRELTKEYLRIICDLEKRFKENDN